jgi:hypothetical protein
MKRSLIGGICVAAALATLTTQAAETVWLSSLNFSEYKPWVGRPKIDKSVDDHALSLKGRTFEHGFGMQARHQVLVQLDGGATRFSAVVGVDDEVGDGRGSVEFRVLGNGRKLLWTSELMHEGQEPKNVDLDVTGVKQLTLLATEGGDGGAFDHADWADAQVTVTGKPPKLLDPNAPTHAEALGLQVSIAMPDMAGAPQINAPATTGVRPGTPFLFAIPASGERPLKFSAKHLPDGLKLDPVTGQIRGVVKKPGDYSVTVRVSNRAGKDERTLRVVVGNTLALTPAMGWNSFDNFGGTVLESQVLEQAHYMAKHLQPVGWQYVVNDYIWYDPTGGAAPPNNKPLIMDAFGRLQPTTNRYPSAIEGKGFKPLADQIHSLGLLFGIHIMRGIPREAVAANLPIEGSSFYAADAADTNSTCNWNQHMYGVRGDTAAGQAYYDSIFRLYAAWGVDYVKVDDISSPYHKDEIEAVRKAIDKCGHSIVLSLSPGATPLAEGAHVMREANLWRETGDFWDNWDQLEEQFTRGIGWRPYVGPGHWPDADMLPVGHIGDQCVGLPRESNFTQPEQMTLLTLWSIQSSPLMVGADLTRNDPWTLALLANPEVLAIDQDSLGAAATRVAKEGDREVWIKQLADGSLAVALFNRGEQDATLAASWAELQLTGRHGVRDLWQRKDLGQFDQEIKMRVAPHGSTLLRVSLTK